MSFWRLFDDDDDVPMCDNWVRLKSGDKVTECVCDVDRYITWEEEVIRNVWQDFELGGFLLKLIGLSLSVELTGCFPMN
jgi:hypothetical protein